MYELFLSRHRFVYLNKIQYYIFQELPYNYGKKPLKYSILIHCPLEPLQTHLIFELLLNKKHKKHFLKIQKLASIKSSEAINRLVIKSMKKLDIYTDENYEMVDKMIVVGLNQDFYLDGAKLGEAEQEFLIDKQFRIVSLLQQLVSLSLCSTHPRKPYGLFN